MVKIKADEKLFDEIKDILYRMNTYLPTIVQNDMEISGEEYLSYLDEYEKFINRLDDWLMKVKKHIKN